MLKLPPAVRFWLAIICVGGTLIVGALSLSRAITTLEDPFAGFFVGPNLLVSISQRAGWPGIERGLKSLDRIVAIDGAPIATIDELLDRVSKHRPGETLIYRIVRDGKIFDIGVPVKKYSFNDFFVVFLMPFLMGLLFVSFGAIIFFKRADSRAGLVYLGLCCVVGLYCMILYESYTTYGFFRLTLVYPIIGAISAHLFYLLRADIRPGVRAHVGVGGLYLLAIVLIVWRQVALYDPVTSVTLSRLSATYVLLVLTADVILLARAYQLAESQSARDRVKVVLIALFIASFAFAGWALNFLRGPKSFYLDEQLILSSIFPIFMGYAILRRNVFNLDRIVRLSLSYGVISAFLLVLYLGVVAGVKEILAAETFSRVSGWVMVALAGLGAYLFHRLRDPANRTVRRWLFRSVYDLSEALNELDQNLATGLSSRELAKKVSGRLMTALRIERGAMVVFPWGPSDDLWFQAHGWADPPTFERWMGLFETEGLLELLRKRGQGVELADLAAERPDGFRQSLATLQAHGVELLVPFVASEKLLALLLCGGRKNHEDFDATDIKLLTPVQLRTALALENAHLAAETARQARLAALGRVASIMVHDIKNPLGTIKLSAESLKRRFREGDPSFELAQIIEEEVDRMNATVGDILMYVKPRGITLGDCVLPDLARDVVERYRKDFESKNVKMEIEAGPSFSFKADVGRLRRALENLLLNAREAMPNGGGVIRIKVVEEGASNGHARAAISIEDTGNGMEASVRERVFQPFFTTKAEGTGLGLAIVKQVIQEHEGEVELETWPGKGTRFTLRLPLKER